MSEIVVDDIIYKIEDEELPEISYYEIITIDEMIKDNPTFIAFSRDEIFNELYDFFKNSNKADALVDMFYKDKTTDIRNYVFVADAVKDNMKCLEQDIDAFIKKIMKINKERPYNEGKEDKNKYYFALAYDAGSKNIRLKPYMKTTIELQDTQKNINIFYPVTESDDTNIPIMAAYYKAPVSCQDDYMSQKVISHLEKPIAFNYAQSEGYTDINKLIAVVKPKMKTILEKLELDKNDYDLDYNHLDGILKRFNTSLEDINTEDFGLLREHLEDILKIKPYDIKYKKFKIKEVEIKDNKKEFYNKLQNIIQLLSFSDKTREDYELLISKLQDDKINVNAPPLLYNNINDIINAVSNNQISLEEVIDNLDANRKVLVLDNAIHTIRNITQNDVASISVMLGELTEKFKQLQKGAKDIFNFHFIELYEDIKEIKEGNDYSNYEGVPDIFKNAPNFEGAVDDMEDGDTIKVGENRRNQIDLEKYWLSIKYKDNVGFTELLKIVVLLFSKIQDTAKLPLNFELLCDELHKYFAGVPSKFYLLEMLLKANDIKEPDEYIKEVIKINPIDALAPNTLVSEEIARFVQQCNKVFCNHLFQMVYTGLAWWSIQIQTDILNDVLIFDDNQYTYIDIWSLDGIPLKDGSSSKHGVLAYLAAITEDIMAEDVYTVPEKLLKECMATVEITYKEVIQKLRNDFKGFEKRKVNKGTETYTQLLDTIKGRKQDRLLNDYINALMYMPSYKFQKVHKFLLGCCLQQIGKEFIVDSDLKGKYRKDMKPRDDLMAAKKKYAKVRETNKTRYPMYVPFVTENKDDNDKDDTVEYVKPEIIEHKVNKNVEDWFDNMKGVSPLLPKNYIDMFSNGTKQASEHAIRFIQIFCKTSGNKHVDFQEMFSKVSYVSVLKIICTHLQKYPYANEEEQILLQNAIECINQMLKHLQTLNECIDQYNKQDIMRIREFVTARALCLPCNPDLAQNNMLHASVAVSSNFVHAYTSNLFTALIKYMKMVKMPTVEENVAFINEIREKNKKETLAIMNTKTRDERELMNTLKKIGLKYDEDGDEKPKINPEMNDIPDDAGEEDFIKPAEDNDNDDNLDEDNYGFLYS